jgi:hypothetical protein
MKKGFLKNNKIFKINLFYVLSLLPIIAFAYYKNGFIPAQKGVIPYWFGTQYFVIPIVIFFLSYVFEVYYYNAIKKEEDLSSVYNSIAPFINVLCYLVTAPMHKLYITIPILVVVDVVLKFLDKKVTVNQVALYKCLIFGLIGLIIGTKGYANYYEIDLIDKVTNPALLFIGKGIGEIGTTSTLCALIGYLILMFNSYYKKEMPIIACLGYAMVVLILFFVGKITTTEILVNIFRSGFIFAMVYVLALSNATPIVRTGRVLFSLIVGIICGVLVNIFELYIGIYITILVFSLLVPLFNKFRFSIGK